MANKKEKIKKSPERIEVDSDKLTPEQIEFAKITMRKEFNEKFEKWAVIEQEDADDDYIAVTKKDLENEVEATRALQFDIASHEEGVALKSAEFLKEFNDKYNSWEKGAWRGIVMFDKVITKIIDELKADPNKDFGIDYQTLVFLYNAMMNPSGKGIESAKDMARFENYNIETDSPYEENVPVTYSGILEKIIGHVRNLSARDKKINILRERMNLAYAGLRMTLKIDSLEEFVEFNDAITTSGVPDNPEDIAKMAEDKD